MSEKLQRMREQAPVYHGALEYFNLPTEYRNVTANEGIVMELTHGCTVSCSFCAIAEKGPIQSKMSWDSASTLVRSLKAEVQEGNDVFYWGTDPFEWSDSGHTYQDLAEIDILEQKRMLYTSTAIPVGTEDQVVRYIQFLNDNVSSRNQADFRISHTTQNDKRFQVVLATLAKLGYEIINKKIMSLDGTRVVAIWQDRLGASTMLRTGNDKLAGKSLVDLRGPACRDGLILTPTHIDTVITMPHSTTVPSSELRIPLDMRAPIYPEPKYTYGKTELLLNLICGSELPENLNFLKTARMFLASINTLLDRNSLTFVSPDENKIPYHVWSPWYMPRDFKSTPVTHDEAKKYVQEATEFKKIFEQVGDQLLATYISMLLTDMEAIRDRRY